MINILLMKRSLSILLVVIIFLSYTSFASRPHGPSKVEIRKLNNGHYQLLVNKRPYIVKGVCYNPVPIGEGHDSDFWSDKGEPWKVDGELMKKMGINTVRFYQPGEDADSMRKVISDLYNLYGIRTIMGHWLGFWNYPAPFYADEDFRDEVKKDVLDTLEKI